MEIQYVYLRTRSQLGKQCIFDDSEVTIEENIPSNPEMMKDYIYKNPIHTGVQNSKQFAVHEIQTVSAITKESGMNHTEGGWPKEVNIKDEEAVMRFRRRVEKDDNWAPRMRNLMEPMERCVLQNNALNIYENFFDDMVPTELVLPLGVRSVNVYEDPQVIVRPITHLSWSPDRGKRLAVSYCSMEFQRVSPELNSYSYIWDIENPNKPFIALKAASPSVTIEFNPRDPSMLISGLMSGQVCNWDIRSGNTPIQVSHPQFSHRNPTNCVLWINSKTNSEFFSASTGGAINWWDIRNLRQPTESLTMDLENPQRGDVVKAIGVSSLQFESTIGTKFMAGMENGVVVSGNRKGQNAAEKLALRFDCHYGPVVSVNRNPFSPKNFLTIGDWTARIWAEDTKEGNLMSTRHHTTVLTGGCWSTSRYSVFYVINDEGMMEVFDILVGLNAPVTTIRLCENSLKAIAPHEEGKLVAVGSDRGKVYLVESSEAITTNTKNDKALLTAYLERCSRFEKAVDNRLKETRLAIRLSYVEPEVPLPPVKEKTKGGKKSSAGPTNKEKKGDEKIKLDDKDRKKVKHKKSKNVWELLGDAELADVERQYFETVQLLQQEIEKYAEATVALGDASDATLATSREISPLKRRKRDSSGVDKDGRRSSSRSKGSRGRKDKGGKTNKNESIVIVKADGTEIALGDVGRTQEKTLDETGTSGIIDEATMEDEKHLEKIGADDEMKVKATLSPRSKRPWDDEPKICEEEICDPTICCLDKIGAVVTSGDVESQIQDAEDSKMNAAIGELLAGLPKNALPSQLEDLPCYTEDEKNQILAVKDASPSVLSGAVKEARKGIQEWKEMITSRKFVARRRLGKFNAKHENDKKVEVTETLLMVSDGDKSSLEAVGTDERFSRSRTTKRTRINECKPIAIHFGSKEIVQVIGRNVKVAKVNPSTKVEQLKREKGDYPRISAVNISKEQTGDDK